MPAVESELEIIHDKVSSSNMTDYVTTHMSNYFGLKSAGQLLGQFNRPPIDGYKILTNNQLADLQSTILSHRPT